MIQLQSRVSTYIGQPAREWQVDGEATIVTKDMRRTVRENPSPVEHGCHEYRIVNTKTNPELAR